MKILFFSHLEQIREHAAYAHALNAVSPIESVLLTMGRKESELAESLGVFDAVKDILPEQADIDDAEANTAVASATLKQWEDRIGSCFVNQDILMDRYFRGQIRLDIDPRNAAVIWTGARTRQLLFLVGKRFEEELARFNPDFLFVETSSAPTRLAWRLAQEKGVPAGGFMSVRFWPERLYLETGIGYDWHQVKSVYREIKASAMTDEERETAQQRLKTIREKKTKPAYLQSEHARGLPRFLKKLDPRLRREGLALWLGKRAATFRQNPRVSQPGLFSPIAQIRRYVQGRKSKRYLRAHVTPFSEICKKRYAIYFLHVQPELTVEEMAFDYQDQVNTLRNILASLPADMYLVVKEHSPMLGYRPLEVYSKLAHMPGILFADTQADSHDLIAGSSVVITLTGTVALEALVYGVPAIVLGSVYFEEFDGIFKPASLNDLRTLLSKPERLPRPDDDDALRMLGSLRRASQPGKPARVDVTLEGIDPESAGSMMFELERLSGSARRATREARG